jgi:hypothetical protein
MSPPARPEVAASLRTSRLVHAAMVASLLVYAFLAHGILAPGGWRGTLDPGAFAVVGVLLYGVGAAVILVVLVLRSRWLSVDGGGGSGPAQLQTRLIILLALAESVGIDGLVLFLLGGNLRDFYVLWAPALVLQLLLAPRQEVWKAKRPG